MPGEERHHDVQATPHELDMVRYWIESAAPYIGTYGALGTGMIGGWPNSKIDTSDRKWPVSGAATEAIDRRCSGCHDRSFPLPRFLSDNFGIRPKELDLDGPRARLSRHLLFNLTRPEKSLILLAPLAKEAGGHGICMAGKSAEGKKKNEKAVTARAARGPVFQSAEDPDYRSILALCREGRDYLARVKRFDMEGFRPRPEYVRELKKYGILPQDTPPDAHFDTYAADRSYWASLWYKPHEE